ncbi:MAG: hypothetical protein WC057_04700 [Dehalococcoidales bacterium]|jgi:hypothetical protein
MECDKTVDEMLDEMLDEILGQLVSYEVTLNNPEKVCCGIGRDPDYVLTRDGKGRSILDLVFPARMPEGYGIFREDEPVEVHIRIAEMTDPAVRTWGDA